MMPLWQQVIIPAGEMVSEPIGIPHDSLHVSSAVRDKATGRTVPAVRFTTVEPAAGQSRIVINEAEDVDLVFRVRAVRANLPSEGGTPDD